MYILDSIPIIKMASRMRYKINKSIVLVNDVSNNIVYIFFNLIKKIKAFEMKMIFVATMLIYFK